MDNKKNFIINVLYIGIIIGILFLIYKYLLGAFMPFIIGFVLAYLSLIISNKIVKKKNNKIFKILSLIIIYILIVVIIVLLTIFITDEFIGFISSLPSLYKTYLDPIISSLDKDLLSMPSDVRNVLSQGIDGLFDAIKNLVTSFSTTAVSLVTSIITYTPTLLISILVTIISSFFFINDYDHIIESVASYIPEKARNELSKIKNFLVNNVFEVIKCYGLIMFITFIELSIGLLLLKIDNAIMLAAVIGVVDILPVLGVGTVLIPWGIIALISGNMFIGIGILVLYLVITIIRNIIEPKFVGSTLGLNPLITLIAMIIGMNLVGLIGLLTAPLIVSYLLTYFSIKDVKINKS